MSRESKENDFGCLGYQDLFVKMLDEPLQCEWCQKEFQDTEKNMFCSDECQAYFHKYTDVSTGH